MKVLHIVENLHHGAVENWLVRMLRHARSKGRDLDWTFYCILGRPGDLDEEVRSLGARIVYSPVPISAKIPFLRALRTELRSGGYEVLHAHHDLVSALYLMVAIGLPLKRRLVHIHNADEAVLTSSRVKKAVLRPILRQACLALADGIIGISNHTLDTFLAGRARRPEQDRVHYYGIDPNPFLRAGADRIEFRRSLCLSEDARILLFAGRVVREKNPLFAIEVFTEMKKRDTRVMAVFAGSGSMEGEVVKRAQELGVDTGLRVLGWRSNIPEIMTSCDWFILPRPEKPMEGLGIAVVEAQLAGLRLLLSKGIADDPLLPGTVWARLGLDEGAPRWADEALRLMETPPPDPVGASEILSQSGFDMDYAINHLLGLYK